MEEDIKQEKECKPYHEGAFVDPAFWHYRFKMELILLLFSIQSIKSCKPKIAMIANTN